MRGLEVRVAFASAMVLMSIDEEAGVDKLGSVYGHAQSMGSKDFEMKCTEVPVLFRDEPILTQGWKQGFEEAVADKEIYLLECQ